MARLESTNDAKIISTTGYLGKYQFSMATLKYLGIRTAKDTFIVNDYLKNEELQDSAMILYMKYNQKIMYHHIKDCVGSRVKDIYITKAGMLAGAHTHGAGAVIIFLNTEGEVDAKDGNGVKVSDRMKKFEKAGAINL